MSKHSNLDSDDKPPAPPAADDHDVDHLMRLLSWARTNGYALGPVVRVGSATVQVVDVRQAKIEGLSTERPQAEPSVYELAGLNDEPVDGTA